MKLINEYLNKTEFSSYEDFTENFKINIPEKFNFAYDVVDKIASENPNKIALVWCNDKGDERTFTFKEIKDYSDRAACFFLENKIKKGDKVMLILKRRYEFWFSILGLHKIGAVTIPATHLLTDKDIMYRNNAANIKMIVCVDEKEVVEHVEKSEPKSPSLISKVMLNGNKDGWINFNERISKVDLEDIKKIDKSMIKNTDTLLLYFTSGTTGLPKMVKHNYVYPLGHILTAKYWQNVIDGGLHLTVADTGWAKAVWGKIYGQWICGSAVFVYDYDKFVPSEMMDVISKYGVTTFCAPPTIYRFFIKENLKKYKFPMLKYCCIAGEPLNAEVYNRFFEATNIKLMEGYGQTELTVTIATYPWIKPRPGSMGKPSAGYDVDIVDENGKSCEIGKEGQIVIHTDKKKPVGMFDGYYNNKALTKKAWNKDIYYTNDMAYRDEDGYFWFVGRADDIIKSSGYKIGPFEVESALIEHPSVLECAITSLPDPVRGQIVKATVVLQRGYLPSDKLKKELKEHVKNVTAPYKYPRVIEFTKELPKTISGKIRRVEIRDKKD